MEKKSPLGHFKFSDVVILVKKDFVNVLCSNLFIRFDGCHMSQVWRDAR